MLHRPLHVLLPALAFSLALASCDDKGGKPSGSAKAGATADTPAPTGQASIKGVVTFAGAIPAPEPWAGAGNADCKSLHEGTIQVVKVQDKKVEDVFVYVKAGLPKGSYPTPSTPVTFSQKACEFAPRVFGVMAGQPIAAGNDDKLMHNVKSPEFNQGFPFGVKKEVKLNDAAVMSTIKCDVHPWMRAYAGVMEHPYFAVTKADGAFEIKGLVDGDYTVEAWHEKLGTQETKVKATAAAAGVADIELKGK